ncbi:MAG: N-acetyltransferase [Acidimicrobiia bacterium]|nr:N-acetyltransferase [Acidimicrobiia bacterium]
MRIRQATMRDIPKLLALINNYAADGIMLPRTEFELAEGIRDFQVAESGRQILGCGALHYYTRSSGEIRSLAVSPSAKGSGVGRKLVEALEEEARMCGVSSLFAFTYVADFFARLGFQQVDRALLPLKAWKDCLRCPKFQNCDEIAVMKAIGPLQDSNQIMHTALPALTLPSELISLSVLKTNIDKR